MNSYVPLKPADWDELPGTIRIGISDAYSDLFMRNCSAVFVEHDISTSTQPGVCYAGYDIVTREMLAEDGLIEQIIRGLDRFVRPWLYRDRYQWPMFDLFPRTTRMRDRLHNRIYSWRLRYLPDRNDD